MRILVVDDDPDARTLTVRALGQEFPEAEIDQAMDPASLDAAVARASLQLLVSDYDLRWGDGLEVLALVKAAHPDCCSVMFTGTGNEEVAVRAMKAGFDDYLVKSPAQLRRLSASVRLTLERRDTLRRLEEGRELFRKELYHRLHNNLQIVISLLRRTAKRLADPDARQQLDDLGRRIQSLSLLQEEFYRSDDPGAIEIDRHLARLAESLSGLAPNVDIEADLQPVRIPVDIAAPMNLIANELITNALKHAFPDGGSGRIVLSLRNEAEGVSLSVADNGAGLQPGALESSMGTE
ncbi:MAG: response regulator, partial [Proteobacteria bacterium]|nr:response regulator [Pseudomonadota bacterium]